MDITAAASDFLRTRLLQRINIQNLEADEFCDNYESEIKRFLRSGDIKYQEYEIRQIALKVYREMKGS